MSKKTKRTPPPQNALLTANPHMSLQERTEIFTDSPHTRQFSKDLIKTLEAVTCKGFDRHSVFRDWLRLVNATLEALPMHTQAVIKTGSVAPPAADTPETQALWAEIKTRYGKEAFTHFAKAFAVLLDSTQYGYCDVLGDTYMEWGLGDSRKGQYFTPWNICYMMSQVTLGSEPEKEVIARLMEAMKAAAAENPALEAVWLSAALLSNTLTGETPQEDDDRPSWITQFFLGKILPHILPYYKPVTIYDPACGSGIMLLSGAACYPDWMVHYGLVQFFGNDVDMLVVLAARANCKLFGLNGFGLKLMLSTIPQPDEAPALPDPTPAPEMETGKAALPNAVSRQATIFEVVRPANGNGKPALVRKNNLETDDNDTFTVPIPAEFYEIGELEVAR